MNLLLIKALGSLAIVTSIFGGAYAGYNHIKQLGYNEATVLYDKKFDEYTKGRDAKLDSLVYTSRQLLEEQKTNSTALSKDMATILTRTKGKSLVVVKDGVCTPSQTFSDSISEINLRVNQSIKDSQQ